MKDSPPRRTRNDMTINRAANWILSVIAGVATGTLTSLYVYPHLIALWACMDCMMPVCRWMNAHGLAWLALPGCISG